MIIHGWQFGSGAVNRQNESVKTELGNTFAACIRWSVQWPPGLLFLSEKSIAPFCFEKYLFSVDFPLHNNVPVDRYFSNTALLHQSLSAKLWFGFFPLTLWDTSGYSCGEKRISKLQYMNTFPTRWSCSFSNTVRKWLSLVVSKLHICLFKEIRCCITMWFFQ